MRAKILVEVDTDQVPGWGYEPQDYVTLIQNHLDSTIGHYNPQVTLSEETKQKKMDRDNGFGPSVQAQ